MLDLDFFIAILKFIGEMAVDFVNSAFALMPVRIVLSVLFGLPVFGIVLAIVRGRKL